VSLRNRIGQILLDRQLITVQQLAEARVLQVQGDPKLGVRRDEKLGRVLIKLGYITPSDLIRALCDQDRHVDYLVFDKYLVEPALVAQMPRDLALRFRVLPLVRLERKVWLVAAPRDAGEEGLVDLGQQIHVRLESIPVDESDFDALVAQCYDTFERRGKQAIRIGETLVRDGHITEAQLEQALAESRKGQKRIGRVLVELGFIDEPTLFRVLAGQKGLPTVTAQQVLQMADKSVLSERLPQAFCTANEVIAYRERDGRVYVATADPTLDRHFLMSALQCTDLEIRVATGTDMQQIFAAVFGAPGAPAPPPVALPVTDEAAADQTLALEDVAEDETLAEVSPEDLLRDQQQYEPLVANMLLQAIKRRTSDIHIENYARTVIVRFRIDGTLYDQPDLHITKKNILGVVNVIKIQAKLNIAERRIPQSGRISKRTSDGEDYDFRVQTDPTIYGENCVIRILHQSGSLKSLPDLGFPDAMQKSFQRIIQSPSGLVLITGPTGSGKTTTLYSTLDILRQDTTKKILTIEDPVEYALERIQQSQVLEAAGYTFATAARSFLREDPNIALIGEIRDGETALEAIKLCQTGHLVFSTLHTSDAISAAARMVGLGMDPEIVAAELLAIVAQRLAKRICPHCRETYDPPAEVLAELFPVGVPDDIAFSRGAGCPRCDNLGHRGRIVLGEFWVLDEEGKAMVAKKLDPYAILERSIGTPSLITMVDDAIDKVAAGQVDPVEIVRVVPLNRINAVAQIKKKSGSRFLSASAHATGV
jgi:type IV pilus assembly protein PilB